MKKIINGKVYNTESAQEVGSWSNNLSYRDFDHCEEALYRKKTGEYFLYGVGGPRSPYAERIDNNSWSGGSAIRPLTFEVARKWAEEKLSAGEYKAIFGEVSEDETDCLISAIIKASNRERLRRAVEQSGKTIGAILDELIEKNL